MWHIMQAKDGVRKAVKSAESLGPVQRLIQAQEQLEVNGLSVRALLGRAALVGLTFGTAFQVTHNNGLLPVRPTIHNLRMKFFLHASQFGRR